MGRGALPSAGSAAVELIEVDRDSTMDLVRRLGDSDDVLLPAMRAFVVP